MKFGIHSAFHAGSVDLAAFAVRCEELGFESLWLPEHGVIPVHPSVGPGGVVGAPIPDAYVLMVDPLIGLTVAAAVTKTLRLGTGVCLIPEHHPVALAKRIASLDLYSNGRFILGTGAGWQPEESAALGGDFPRRWAQTVESLTIMHKLWTEDEPAHAGTYDQFPPLRFHPKPVQTPDRRFCSEAPHRGCFSGPRCMPTAALGRSTLKGWRQVVSNSSTPLPGRSGPGYGRGDRVYEGACVRPHYHMRWPVPTVWSLRCARHPMLIRSASRNWHRKSGAQAGQAEDTGLAMRHQYGWWMRATLGQHNAARPCPVASDLPCPIWVGMMLAIGTAASGHQQPGRYAMARTSTVIRDHVPEQLRAAFDAETAGGRHHRW